MSEHDVIEESGDFRVRVTMDEYPEQPYDDGGSPILSYRWSDRYGWEVGQVDAITSYVLDSSIAGALSRALDHGGPRERREEIFERYLRIFHGMRSIEWHTDYNNDHQYVTFDTAHWREWVGWTEAVVAQYVENSGDDQEPGPFADMSEYKAWLEGEVYAYIVEKRVTWQRLGSDGEPVFEVDNPIMQTWEVVDSCGGFYGDREYVETEAREALEAHAGESEAA